LLALAGIPVAKLLRTWRRRRAAGAAGVVAAWAEARDLLRSHGVRVTSGMTVRDVAAAYEQLHGPAVSGHLKVLAVLVDSALWSGADTQPGTVDGAWAAVLLVRRGLAGRSVRRRLGAALRPGTLLPPRPGTVVRAPLPT
jgi:hypothetical protein